ncbi:hypothetical protein Ahia01_000424600 [Argonauta hians]
MKVYSLLPFVALICATFAATLPSKAEEQLFSTLIKNRLNQDVSIVHFVGIQHKDNKEVATAVIGLGPENTPEEKIYDCKFVISNNGTHKSLDSFSCENLEVPYGAAPPPPLHVAGGWSPVRNNNNGVQNVINFLKAKLLERNPPLKIVGIDNVQSQVVAGLNFRIIVQAGPQGPNNQVTHTCDAIIYVQTWLNHMEVTQIDCHSIVPVPYLGGWQNANINDVNVVNAAKFALKALNSQCNCLFRKSVGQIVSASRQVVNGWKYKIVWEIGQSTCRNNEVNNSKDVSECPLQSVNEVSQCEVVVWEQPHYGGSDYSLINHNC